MTISVSNRYQVGILLAKYKSTDAPWYDNEDDCLILELCAQAQQDSITKCWDLVIFFEIEIVAIKGDGTDTGNLEPGREIYKFPFIYDSNARKIVLRAVMDNFRETMSTTPSGLW